MKDFVAGDTIYVSNLPIWKDKQVIGYESFEAKVLKEWYDCNQRHWFRLIKSDGSIIKKQGKNLYSCSTIIFEAPNHPVLAENKHYRKRLGYN